VIFPRPNASFLSAYTNITGATFTVLVTIDLSLSWSNLTFLGTITDNPLGQFQFTGSQAANSEQHFYRVVPV
jgi:hypothetical protein